LAAIRGYRLRPQRRNGILVGSAAGSA
jgi:hypothetical protein